mgnify:CR=1 FL=1
MPTYLYFMLTLEFASLADLVSFASTYLISWRMKRLTLLSRLSRWLPPTAGSSYQGQWCFVSHVTLMSHTTRNTASVIQYQLHRICHRESIIQYLLHTIYHPRSPTHSICHPQSVTHDLPHCHTWLSYTIRLSHTISHKYSQISILLCSCYYSL